MSKDVGFKAGLEIHQQLAGTKLFCDCPAEIIEDEPDFSVTRMLRASSGESGEVDIAAAHEQRKQKQFVYQGHQHATCLVELDEEPVSAPGEDSLKTAVMVADMLSMKRFDDVHVMRKVVVDGSNTSGFQRTMAVASDGVLSDVRIDRLCLEEDSCKVVSRGQQEDVYNLSRLGIPLLEITTKPDITSPQQLQDVASEIGMVLRSTGRVKRGLGTIRQDVNISIADGARVEIKGVQDLDTMPLLAENEVKRQQGLVEIHNHFSSNPPTISTPVDVTAAFSNASGASGWVAKAITTGAHVIGVSVTDVAGVLGKEFYEGYRFGTELAGYAKADGFGGIIHSDEAASKYGLDSWDEIHSSLETSSDDGFILLVSPEIDRMKQTLTHTISEAIAGFVEHGVISCVRKANADATSTYLRPMPGSARMYPETDVRTVDVTRIDVETPKLLTEVISDLVDEFGIDEGVATQLVKADRVELFTSWANSLSPAFVAEVLVSKEKELRRRHEVAVDIEGVADELFKRLSEQSVSKSAVDDILLMHANKGSVDWSAFETISEGEIKKVVQEVISSDPDAPMGALMGACMGRLRGKADGKVVSRLLREELHDN